jgi:hypothetical protein
VFNPTVVERFTGEDSNAFISCLDLGEYLLYRSTQS